MKKNYLITMSVLALFSSGVFAQKAKKYNGDEAFQKTLTFSSYQNKENALSQFTKLYNLDVDNSFQEIRTTSDESGLTHQRLQQYYKGIKVEFGTVITHSRNGVVESVNGELYNPNGLNLKTTLTTEQGLQAAANFIGAQRFMWDDQESAAAMNYQKPQGELVIFPFVNSGDIRLAYKYDVYATQPLSRDEVFVDAHTGEILFRNPIIKHAQKTISSPEMDARRAQVADAILTGKSKEEVTKLAAPFAASTAATRYSGTQTIQTDMSGSNYILSEATRTTNGITGNGVHTYNSNKTNTYPLTDFTNTTTTWNSGAYASNSATKNNAALDAHWGAEKVFDWWSTVFNRNSYDNNGAKILSWVHYDDVPGGTGFDNAFWNGTCMTYGDGNTMNVLTALDVCGHEIGHAVCSYTAGLAYQNHSGAMNEALSDIWGTCIEWWGRNGNFNAPADGASPGTQATWKIGEDILSGGLRSMSWPRSKGNPDTYKGTSWTGTSDDGTACTPTGGATGNDYCGVHNNSGVLNHWFYLVTIGKTSWTNNATPTRTTTTVGIGMQKSSQITYYAERDYLTPNATYTDMRNATIAVASSLYCASSQEVQTVTRAWYAVNVGTDYTAATNDVGIKSISGGNTNLGCGSSYSPSIVLENGGTAALTSATITYNIDGGANSTINWTGNLANCSQAPQAINVSGLTRGFHILNVTATTGSDGNATNNTKSIVIVVNDNGTVGTTNSFNAATDVLVSIDANGKTNNVWQRGTLSGKTNLTNAVAGSQVYATRLTSATYTAGDYAYLVSQCYNLSNYTNPSVSFDMAFDLETNYDFVNLEYSTDSGATWSILGTSTDTGWYNSNRTPSSTDCDSCPGQQWTGLYATGPTAAEGGTGVNGNKRNYTHTLSPFGFGGATPASNIIFRFNFFADGGVNQQGVFIDNFVIQGVLARTENQFSQFSVYPNPSKGIFNVELSTSEKVGIQLYDMRGRSVYNKTFDAEGVTFNKQIDLSSLSSGVYILNVESAGKKEGMRIIIE